MKRQEAEQLVKDVCNQITKKGVPINVRLGGSDAVDWIRNILSDCIKIDKPIGVIDDIEYDFCPNCRHVVGAAALYCKHCGSMIREKVQT